MHIFNDDPNIEFGIYKDVVHDMGGSYTDGKPDKKKTIVVSDVVIDISDEAQENDIEDILTNEKRKAIEDEMKQFVQDGSKKHQGKLSQFKKYIDMFM